MEDFWDIPVEHFITDDKYDEESHKMIKNKFWTGMVEFKKTNPEEKTSGSRKITKHVEMAFRCRRSTKRLVWLQFMNHTQPHQEF